MKEKNTKKIVLRYTGAAAAVLGSQAVNAQIEHTPANPRTANANGQSLLVNLDNDTVADFRITQLVDSADFSGVLISTASEAANQVLGLDYGNYNYPFKLQEGDVIGPGQPFNGLRSADDLGYMALSVYDTVSYPNDQFDDGMEGYLGVRFEGTNEEDSTISTYYGWIRIEVAADLKSFTVSDYAYETTPDSMILAGYGDGIGLEEEQMERIDLSQRGEFLDLEIPASLRAEASLRFYDLNGVLLREEEIKNHQQTISLVDLPKGVLVATLENKDQKVSKKILIY